jgi:von Willebrand factor type A domain
MKTTILILTASLAFLANSFSTRAAEPGAPAKAEAAPVVQIAILLDTSGSMQGLIEQAKGQLWKIVNEFISAKQNGKRPDLEVALYEYGKSSLSKASGWIRQIVPLTNDLDKISEELFKLTTDGGDEYCGWVIKDAVEQLGWSKSPDAFKAIFIAGNEPFTQGPVDYATSCKAAIEKGIIVNTIHCGPDGVGIQTKWQAGALLAEGKYMLIDHNQAVVHFDAPQDKEIARLGVELNKTYIAFGTVGRTNLARQAAQDANSSSLAAQGSSVQRALAKSSALYCNSSWDLVDACKATNFSFSTLKAEDLPVEMQKMTEVERKAYVDTKTKEREKLQAEINRLNADRNKYVAEQSKKHTATNTLDSVVVTTVREQAAKRNYKFE